MIPHDLYLTSHDLHLISHDLPDSSSWCYAMADGAVKVQNLDEAADTGADTAPKELGTNALGLAEGVLAAPSPEQLRAGMGRAPSRLNRSCRFVDLRCFLEVFLNFFLRFWPRPIAPDDRTGRTLRVAIGRARATR